MTEKDKRKLAFYKSKVRAFKNRKTELSELDKEEFGWAVQEIDRIENLEHARD